MSFYGGSGYPPSGGGYPPQGYPPQQPGYPGGAAYPPQGNPYPGPAQPGYPPAAGGGLPYPVNPSADIGFGMQNTGMPAGGMPPYGAGQVPYGGYPSQPGAPGSYPPQHGAPGGYPPQAGGAGGYPPQTGGAYPPQHGAGVGYPPQTGAGGAYPPQPGTGSGYPPQPGAGGAYPSQSAAAGSYPSQQGAGYPPNGGHHPPSTTGHHQSFTNPPPAASYQPPSGGQQPHHGATYPGHGAPPVGGVSVLPTNAMGALSLKSTKSQGQGTIVATPGFNAERDAEILRKAMKGFGTDEKAIIDVLAMRTNEERMKIKLLFKTMYGKDLIKELKSELSGRLEDVVLALMTPTVEFEASEMKRAIDGLGTNEDTLIEILCSRTVAQVNLIKDTYKKLYKRDLEKDLIKDTSGHFRRLMVALAAGGRQENQPVDPAKAKQDAADLHRAGEARWGTDESKFNHILCSQSFEQLRLVFDQYAAIAGRTIEQSITREMSGDIKDGMLAIVKVVRYVPAYFAERLYKSMKGAGTADRALIRIVVTRSEVDMVQIKQEFQRQYNSTLEKFITDDCSGDYKKILLAIVSNK